jgi:hypothetical protein
MFIFVHHPHFLADLRCVCRSLMCKSVSWFNTVSVVVISEVYTAYKSLYCVVQCGGKILWWEVSNLAWLFALRNCIFKWHNLKTLYFKTVVH